MHVDPARGLRELLLDALTVTSASGVGWDKDSIRRMYAHMRLRAREARATLLKRRGKVLLSHFAEGREIDPQRVSPVLEPVRPGTEESALFRMATLWWSVPVSDGFGRRMRFLVRDASNGKLIGILALGDPVFNLRARDEWVGWTATERRERLTHVMDAFVLGAVPPYSFLLGGKLVGSMVFSDEVQQEFDRRYRYTAGIISGRVKSSRLALVTVTSALGRSSLYNRLKVNANLTFLPVGWTEGWGHFHIPAEVFARARDFLLQAGHPYANGNRFGQGPNWKIRVLRVAAQELGLETTVVRHGVRRQVFVAPTATNTLPFLRGEESVLNLCTLPARELGLIARERWIIPRAKRDPRFRHITRDWIWEALSSSDPQGGDRLVSGHPRPQPTARADGQSRTAGVATD